MSAARGAVLIGLAVVIGIVLLQVIDNGGPSAHAGDGDQSPAPCSTTPATNLDGTPAATTAGTTATTKAKKTTSAKAAARSQRPGGRAGAQRLGRAGCGDRSAPTTSRPRGTRSLPAGNAPAQRTGTIVQCKPGYEKEADALVATLNELGVPPKVEADRQPAPGGLDAAATASSSSGSSRVGHPG